MKLLITLYSYVAYLCDDVHPTCAWKFGSYLTEDAARVHCKDEQATDVSCYWDSQGAHKYSMWQNTEAPNFAARGICSHQWTLNGYWPFQYLRPHKWISNVRFSPASWL